MYLGWWRVRAAASANQENVFMPTISRRPAVSSVIVPLVAWLLFALAGTAPAHADVRDEAKFFSDDAVRQANDAIAQIKRDFGKDVVIQTHATIPDAARQRFGAQMDNQFFDRWVRQAIRDQKLDGIAVLITRDPPHLQVGVDSDTGKQAFIKTDNDKLSSLLAADFREKQFDRGLQRAVEYVQTTLARSIGTRGASGASGANAQARDPSGVLTSPGRPSEQATPPRDTSAPPPPESSARSSAPPPADVPVGTSPAPSRGMGLGGWMLLIVVAVIVIGLLRRVFAARSQVGMATRPGYGS